MFAGVSTRITQAQRYLSACAARQHDWDARLGQQAPPSNAAATATGMAAGCRPTSSSSRPAVRTTSGTASAAP